MKKKKTNGSVDKERFLINLGITYSKELIARATSWELTFREILERAGIPYIFQYPVVCEKNFLYILDFYLPDYNIAFELDGAHHYEKNKVKSDKIRTKRILSLGIRVKRLMNKSIKEVTPEMIKKYLIDISSVKSVK